MALQIRHTQTPVARTLDTDLSTDHRPCTSPEQSGKGLFKGQLTCFRQRKYSQSKKTYTAHPSALTFKDNLLESQIPTWAFTLACTSDQFRSSWRSDPNHAQRMRMDPSLQRKGPGIVLLPLQAPSRKPSLLSKLTLPPAIRSYSTTASFTAFISRRRETKTVMSSENAETLAVRGPAKGTPRRARLVPSSLGLRRKGSNART